MAEAMRKYGQEAGEVHIKVTATIEPNAVVLLPDNRVAVHSNMGAAVAGDVVAVFTQGVYDIDSASATTFILGDEAYFSLSSRQAVTQSAAAAGDPRIGIVVEAKAAGSTSVAVDLNATAGTLKS